MLELEKKVMLTEEQYNCIKSHFGHDSEEYFQTNYYFDTEDLSMNKNGITCRIRFKNGIYKATIKHHLSESQNCSFEDDLFEGDRFDPNAFKALGLILQGNLLTERTILYKNDFCEMVLDRNTYLGTCDHELEIEYSSGYEKSADSLMNKIKNALLSFNQPINDYMILNTGVKSKSQRFFEKKNIGDN